MMFCFLHCIQYMIFFGIHVKRIVNLAIFFGVTSGLSLNLICAQIDDKVQSQICITVMISEKRFAFVIFNIICGGLLLQY